VARAVLKRQACAPGPSRQQCQADDAKTMLGPRVFRDDLVTPALPSRST
jgi:hypothetical protein